MRICICVLESCDIHGPSFWMMFLDNVPENITQEDLFPYIFMQILCLFSFSVFLFCWTMRTMEKLLQQQRITTNKGY